MEESETVEKQGLNKKRLINTLSSLHFAPNTHCKNLLLAEGVEERKIFSVGSPLLESGRIISSSELFISKTRTLAQESPYLGKLVGSHFVLIELDCNHPHHERIMEDVRRLVLTNSLVKIVLLLINSNRKDSYAEVFAPYNLMTIDKVSHLERCFLYANASFVLSDSVDVIEECAGFGTRSILLQSSTMRLDLVSSGWMTLAGAVGQDLDRKFQSLMSEAKLLPSQVPMKAAESHLSGAARRIVAALTSRTIENVQRSRTSLQL
jgi:UDP-N-acetylglucosamine 2-epimerase